MYDWTQMTALLPTRLWQMRFTQRGLSIALSWLEIANWGPMTG